MAEVKDGDTIKVHYTGKFDDGSVFDSSEGKDPLEFTVGTMQVIPGFDNAVKGMAVGDSKNVVIAAEQAYGPRHDELVLKVPKDQFPADLNPELGQQLSINQADGSVVPVVVAAVEDNEITLDANHPLAGKQLNFDLELAEIV